MEELVDSEYQKLRDAKELARKAITTHKPEYIKHPHAVDQREGCITVFDKVIDVYDAKDSYGPRPGITQNCEDYGKKTPCLKSDCPHYLKYLAYIKAGALLKAYEKEHNIGDNEVKEMSKTTLKQKWENFRTEWKRLSADISTKLGVQQAREQAITLVVADKTPVEDMKKWCITKFEISDTGIMDGYNTEIPGTERAYDFGMVWRCEHFCYGCQKCNEECDHKDDQNAYVDATDAYDTAWNARWDFVKNSVKHVFMRALGRPEK